MSESLRMVILADYVQRDYLSSVGSDDALVHVGVIPIFEALRRRVGGTTKIAAISGSVIVIPRSALDEVKRFAAQLAGISRATSLRPRIRSVSGAYSAPSRCPMCSARAGRMWMSS